MSEGNEREETVDAMMYRFVEKEQRGFSRISRIIGWLEWFLIDRMDGKFWRERSGKKRQGGKKKEKWFGPFPSLNVFSNSCVQFPRFLRPRNVPYLSVECSCTMRVSSKRMAMAMHVFILLLHLTYYHVSFFFWDYSRKRSKKNFFVQFSFPICGNFMI